MFIEDVTIDGFKSYANKVTVPNFDRHFNAITGLNGTGKSNILDSICFVLGITNLSQVRAGSLKELVYKQGQAGVTKATVSITFNNMDKEQSPVGYEDKDQITVTRQVVIGGRNKYLINGHVAQPGRVQNLFHSVQLNVNNPHFLIMQGRITKVLNMKPHEILSMLEEAAGTRMYETKKVNALKTMEKKQIKVEEIDKVLSEDILPALEKLRGEREEYMSWAAANQDIDRLKRFVIAYEYIQYQKSSAKGLEAAKQKTAQVDELEQSVVGLESEMQEKDSEIESLRTEKELQAGGEMKELSSEVDELMKAIVKFESDLKSQRDNLNGEEQSLEQLKASATELDDSNFQRREEQAVTEKEAAVQGLEEATAAVEAAGNELAGAQAGDGRDSSNRSMQERLADAQNAQTSAEAEAKEAEMRAKHATKELASAQKSLAAKRKEGSELEKKLEAEQAAVVKCEEQILQLGFNQAKARSLEAVVQQETAAVSSAHSKVEELRSQLAGLDFRFADPERGFDRSKVKGVVGRLVKVNDPNAVTALEVAAGGKLYQVIVDSAETAKALLSKGQLRNRVTIIPLDKVSGGGVSQAAQRAAGNMAPGGGARLALELVGYDSELASAMKYVFGLAFVCKDQGIAKKLAFSREVASRCITVEGDDFNPSGTLTGGSRRGGGNVLKRVSALNEAEEELRVHQQALCAAQQELQGMSAVSKQHQKLVQQLELKTHSLHLLKERVAGSEWAQLADTVADWEVQVSEAEGGAEAAKERRAAMVAEAKQLEKDIANFGQEKEKRIKAAEKKVKDAKAQVLSTKAVLKAAEQAVATVQAERTAAASEREGLTEQLAKTEEAIQGLQKAVADLEGHVSSSKDELKVYALEKKGLLSEMKARLKECDREISQLEKAKAKAEKRIQEIGSERKKLEREAKTLEADSKDAHKLVTGLAKENPWIESEQQFFGQPGGDYDWEARSPEVAKEELISAMDTHEKLKKRVNKNVMNMFEKAEEEYGSLLAKKNTLEKDKEKIQNVIAELDEKKREALGVTWEKVNKDFGSIFSTLLPGTSAKLDPPEGGTFMDGLEVKVAFGGVWKQSLTELSGGQRSLLALSLVLSLLLFKPAPIYILDEVDSALDLSHTQNIGRMIKTHFPFAQFLVVSLKEGMFNNANVIFRTKFVDGVSAVNRTVPSGAEAAAQPRQSAAAHKGASRGRAPLRENVR